MNLKIEKVEFEMTGKIPQIIMNMHEYELQQKMNKYKVENPCI